ncbi:MotA/TolQ/ExbB proton channel family protein [Candidatus Omnitrophota bacterium]
MFKETLRKGRVYFVALIIIILGWTAIGMCEEGVVSLEDGMTFRQLMRAGGIVMIVIECLSVLIIALGIISFIVIRRRRFMPEEIVEVISQNIKQNNLKKAFSICEEHDNPLCRILGAGIKRALELFPQRKSTSKGNLYVIQRIFVMENIKKSMETVGMRELDRLRNLVIWFSNIGVIAPMLGLLGTVLGMIKAFGAIAFKVETGKPVLLSSAIDFLIFSMTNIR